MSSHRVTSSDNINVTKVLSATSSERVIVIGSTSWTAGGAADVHRRDRRRKWRTLIVSSLRSYFIESIMIGLYYLSTDSIPTWNRGTPAGAYRITLT